MSTKLGFFEISATLVIALHPALLMCQNSSVLDTSPKTQEESNRIHQHGALPEYSIISPRRNLRDSLKKSNGRPVDIVFDEGDISTSPSPVTIRDWLQDQVCHADLVVMARMNRQVSGLTSDEALVISDYYFTLEDLIRFRGTSRAPARGSTIVVNTAGGAVDLPEGRASTKFTGLTAFEPNQRYLLFLKNLPIGDYRPTQLGAAFVLPQSGPPRGLYRMFEDRFARSLSTLSSTSFVSLVASLGDTAFDCKGTVSQ